jgi:hypothetical protein
MMRFPLLNELLFAWKRRYLSKVDSDAVDYRLIQGSLSAMGATNSAPLSDTSLRRGF